MCRIENQQTPIGVYPNGIGFGNLSDRAPFNGFFISGTTTGRLPVLEEKHYALVNSWSFGENSLQCSALINASAESLSHAAIYESLPKTGAVIHVHHKGMWDEYFNDLPTTSPDVLYGTPEMAKPGKDSCLVMGGHEEGIIVWGKNLDDAGEKIMNYYQSFQKQG